MYEVPEEWKRPSGMRKFGFWSPLGCLILASLLHLFLPDWEETPRSKYLEPTLYWQFPLWGAGAWAGIAWFVFLRNRRWRDVLFLLVSHAAFGCLITAYITIPRSGRIALVSVVGVVASGWGVFTGLRRLLEKDETENQVNVALVLLANGRMQRALTRLNRALRNDESNSLARLTRGLVLADTGRHTQAVADLTRALDLEPDLLMALQMRGIVYARQGRYHEATADFSSAIAEHPNESDLYIHRAEAFMALGDYSRAWADAERADRLLDPATPGLVNVLREAAPQLEP